MATHSSILAWKIPWMEEPDRLQSMGSQRVRTQLSDFTFFLSFCFKKLIDGEWGGRREEGSGWGTHVYLWRIHFDIWQN